MRGLLTECHASRDRLVCVAVQHEYCRLCRYREQFVRWRLVPICLPSPDELLPRQLDVHESCRRSHLDGELGLVGVVAVRPGDALWQRPYGAPWVLPCGQEVIREAQERPGLRLVEHGQVFRGPEERVGIQRVSRRTHRLLIRAGERELGSGMSIQDPGCLC